MVKNNINQLSVISYYLLDSLHIWYSNLFRRMNSSLQTKAVIYDYMQKDIWWGYQLGVQKICDQRNTNEAVGVSSTLA